MTNEAVKIELTNEDGFPRRFTVSATEAITKGSLLKLTDPRTATQANNLNNPIAGIASEEHTATDGVTEISVWTDGIFDMVASGAIGVGQAVTTGGGVSNQVSTANAIASGAQIIGYALETASDTETINIRVKL